MMRNTENITLAAATIDRTAMLDGELKRPGGRLVAWFHVAEFSSPTVIGCAQNFIWSVNGNAYLILNIFFAINPIIPVRTVL